MAFLLANLVVHQHETGVVLPVVAAVARFDRPAAQLRSERRPLQLNDLLVEPTESLARLFELDTAKTANCWMFGQRCPRERAIKHAVDRGRKSRRLERLVLEGIEDTAEPTLHAVLTRQ